MIGLGLAAATGCTPAASTGGFDSPDPASKLYAISRAGQQKDASAISHLIQQLESDDPAVRLYAIQALHRITGLTHGYVHYDAPSRRHEAIQRWVAAYESGALDARSSAASATK